MEQFFGPFRFRTCQNLLLPCIVDKSIWQGRPFLSPTVRVWWHVNELFFASASALFSSIWSAWPRPNLLGLSPARGSLEHLHRPPLLLTWQSNLALHLSATLEHSSRPVFCCSIDMSYDQPMSLSQHLLALSHKCKSEKTTPLWRFCWVPWSCPPGVVPHRLLEFPFALQL